MKSEPGGKGNAPGFYVDEEWVSGLPFERLPKGITHLPLEGVVYTRRRRPTE